MPTEVDSHISKITLDSAGFEKGAKKVLDAIDEVNKELSFKKALSAADKLTSTINVVSKTMQRSSAVVVNSVGDIGVSFVKLSKSADAAFSAVWDVASACFNKIKSASSNTVSVVRNGMEEIASVISNGEIEGAVSKVADRTASIVERSVSNIRNDISSNLSSTVSEVGTVFDGLSIRISSAFIDATTPVYRFSSILHEALSIGIYDSVNLTEGVTYITYALLSSVSAAELFLRRMSDIDALQAQGFGPSPTVSEERSPDDIRSTAESTAAAARKLGDDVSAAGEKAEESVRKAGDAAEEAGEKVAKSAKKAGDAAEEAEKKTSGISEKFTQRLTQGKIFNTVDKVMRTANTLKDGADVVSDASSSVKKAVDTIGAVGKAVDALDPKVEAAGNTAKASAGKVTKAAKDASNEAKASAEQVKKSATEAAKTASDASGATEKKVSDSAKNIKAETTKAAKDASNEAKASAEQVKKSATEAAKTASESAKNVKAETTNSAETTAGAVKKAAKTAEEAFKDAPESAKSAVNALTSIDKAASGVFSTFKDAKSDANGVLGNISKWSNVVFNDFGSATETIGDAFKNAQKLVSDFSKENGSAESTFGKVADGLKKHFSETASGMGEAFTNTSILIKDLGENSGTSFGKVSSAALSAGGDIGDAMSKIGTSVSKMSEVVDRAKEKSKGTFGSISALSVIFSKDFSEAMGSVGEAISSTVGIFGKVHSSIKNTIDVIKGVFSSDIHAENVEQASAQAEKATEKMAETAETSAERTKNAVSGVSSAAKEAAADMKDTAESSKSAAKVVEASSAAISIAPKIAKAALIAGATAAGVAIVAKIVSVAKDANKAIADAFDSAKKTIDKKIESIKHSFDKIRDFFKNGFTKDEFAKLVSEDIDKIKKKISELTPHTSEALGELKRTISNHHLLITQAIQYSWDQIYKRIHDKLAEIHAAVSATFESIRKVFSKPIDSVKSIGEKFSGHFSKAKKEADEFRESIDAAKKDIDAATEAAKNFESAVESAVNAAPKTADSEADMYANLMHSVHQQREDEAARRDAPPDLERYTEDIAAATGAVKESTSATEDYNEALSKAADSLPDIAAKEETYADGLAAASSAASDASDAAADAAYSEQSFDEQLRAVVGSGKEAAEETKSFGEQLREVVGSGKEASAETKSFDEQLQEVVDSGKEASEETKSFDEQLQEVVGSEGEAKKETKSFAEQLDEAEEKFDILGDGAKDSAKDFEIFGDATKGIFAVLKSFSGKGESVFSKLGDVIKGVGEDTSALGKHIKDDTGFVVALGAAFNLLKIIGPDKILDIIKRRHKENTEEAEKSSNAIDILAGNFGALEQTISNGLDKAKEGFVGTAKDVLNISAAFAVVERAVNRAIDAGKNFVKSLSVDRVADGWREYELKVNSVQTIMQGTGEPLEVVEAKLDELNEYADRTIYSFSDMTDNIGKFTNQGVKLEDAVAAMKGISNEAALSGASTQQASNAMYNFAQALSLGYVQNVDWKSIENAMMATVGFKEELIKTGAALGTLTKKEDKWISTTKDANGHISDAFDASSGFRDSLKSQWLTNEVLIETLKRYANEEEELGRKAYAAAQDIKTATQLMDTLKESVGSGWAKTFELIIGDFEEAKKFWIDINNLVSPVLDAISDKRNNLVQGWKNGGGRDKLITSLKEGLQGIVDIAKAVKDGLSKVFAPLTSEKLLNATNKITKFFDKLKPDEGKLGKISEIFQKIGDVFLSVKGIFSDVWGYIIGTLKRNDNTTVIGSMVKSFSDGTQTITGTIDRILDRVSSFADSLKGFIDRVRTYVQANRDEIKTFTQGIIDVINAAKKVVGAALSNIKSAWGNLLPWVSGVISGAIEAIGKLMSKIASFISKHDKLILAIAGGIKMFITARGILTLLLPKILAVSGAITKATVAIKTVIATIKLIKALKLGTAVKGLAGHIVKILNAVLPALNAGLKKMGIELGDIVHDMAMSALKTMALNAAIMATVAAVTAAVAIYRKWKESLREAAEEKYGLTQKEKEHADAMQQSSETSSRLLEDQKEATKATREEYDEYQNLVGELQGLVGKNGEVAEAYQERADTIVSELGAAFELEKDENGKVAGTYQEIIDKINETIKKKRELAIINATEEQYNNAKQNVEAAGAAQLADEKALEEAQNKLSELYAERDRIQGVADSIFGRREDSFGIAGMVRVAIGSLGEAKINAEIEALENKINGEGGLIETLAQSTEAYTNFNTIISNVEGFVATANAGEDTSEALFRLENGIKSASTATKEELVAQADAAKEALDQAKALAAAGDPNASEEYLAKVQKIYDIAAEELAKTGEKGWIEYGRVSKETFDAGESDRTETGEKAVSDIVEGIDSKTPLFKPKGYEQTSDWMAGMQNGISEHYSPLKTLVDRVLGLFIDKPVEDLDEGSPSRLAEKITAFYGDGMIIGLKKKEDGVRSASTALTNAITSSSRSIESVLSDDYSDAFTISPVVDASAVGQTSRTLADLLAASSYSTGTEFSWLKELPKSANEKNPTLDELRGLRADMARFNERLGRLQVRMDSGVLVGELADPMDEELGRRATIGQRG